MSPAQQVSAQRLAVLIVEDDEAMRRVLCLLMREQGYEALECGSGAEALELVATHQPALVLLDLGLPDVDGIDLAHTLRERSRVPILVLTIRSDEASIEEALDGGANDYVTKPFREKELFARIRACLRGLPQADSAVVAPLVLDSVRRTVTVAGRTVRVSGTECKLLSELLRAGGSVLTHQQLLRQIWGKAHTQDAGYLRVYVHHLREKLEVDPANPVLLLTEPGVGYRLNWE